MNTKVSDLTIEEIKEIISEIMDEKLENLLEDLEARSSDNFNKSIKKARKDYKQGNHKSFEEVFKDL
ncbi:MAG TPA: hypothetical protein VJ455_03180 [Ignavibacteria bacterium]|nr:hypothetical protein [Ignavibacteria bacterium]